MAFYAKEDRENGRGIQIETVAMFVSDSSYLSVTLDTCFRATSTVRDKNFGFKANVRFEGV